MKNFGLGFFAIFIGWISACSTVFAAPAQSPLFLTQSASPMVTLAMSVDHELFKKAYNDYSNLDGGNLRMVDTTYRNDFKYYGYFDSDWCYGYTASTNTPSNSRFVPLNLAVNHQCTDTAAGSGRWSGNFLNWATMTRIDVLRRVLFGGKRSVDSTTRTVLERTYLPKDAHAFVKVYEKSDVNLYTPYSTTISMCNVSTGSGANDYPTIRVASGKWRQWSASEGQQCRWRSEVNNATNPRNNTESNNNALATLVAKVEVCVLNRDSNSQRCKPYTSTSAGVTTTTYKPIGLLQRRGETGNIRFGLMTGSYRSSLSGGVLRKQISRIANNTDPALDEINLGTGIFNTGVSGIISNINALKIASYSFSGNNYTDCSTYSIGIQTVKAQATANRRCNDWGNPLAEIYLETLRYMSGKAVTAAFAVDDTASTMEGTNTAFPGVAGLTNSSWGSDPLTSDNWCANCSIIVLSTGSNSFDGDDLAIADLPNLSSVSDINGFTNTVGNLEFGGTFAGNYFGGSTTDGDRQCKSRALTGLSGAIGICPELPALEGTYAIAGLAYYANTQDLRPNYQGKQTIKTYAVDLAESLPSFSVPVGSGTVNFLPACEAQNGSSSPWLGCSLFDVQVESITTNLAGQPTSGSYLFYWEDSLWGSDYDIDGAQRITFCVGAACNDASVGANQIKIVSSVPYAFAGNNLRFSYTITGTTADGLQDNPWSLRPGGNNYDTLKATPDTIPAAIAAGTVTTKIFTVGSSTATLLKRPLYYVGKYGGFTDADPNVTPNEALEPDIQSEWDSNNDGVPDNYFNVSNPAKLEESLDIALTNIANAIAAASSAAISSTRISEGAYVYQARFSSSKWNGELAAYEFNADGSIGSVPDITTNTTMPAGDTRAIYTRTSTTYNSVARSFTWANLTAAQQTALNAGAADAVGQARLAWLRGNPANEGTLYRDRGAGENRRVLGDIINSSPVYVDGRDMRYNLLPGAAGSSYSAYLQAKRARPARIFVGANDGMLHVFRADNLTPIYSYIPDGVYPKLVNLTKPNYGTAANPHQYTMDGQIAVGDVFFPSGSGGEWKTILVASLGAGGKSVFALDVTETNTAPRVLFDFKWTAGAENVANGLFPRIGHVLGKPFIVPLKNGRFAAVFNNGYDSGNGSVTTSSSLFLVDLAAPTSANTRIVTATGAGLSTPELLTNGIGQVEYAYAGDLSGNVWKFDLSSTNSADWDSEILFRARDAGDNIQPITSAPTLGRNALKDNAVTVYFGTGKYYETSDNQTNATPVHSFYAIVDSGAEVTGRSLLDEKTINETTTSRTIGNDKTVDWTSKQGWYLDFNTTNGERVNVKPLLLYDRLIFPTLIPDPSACGFGGSSWLMQVRAVGDKFDGEFLLDEIVKNEYLIPGDPSFGVINDDTGTLVTNASSGALNTDTLPIPPGALGRMNWRQLD